MVGASGQGGAESRLAISHFLIRGRRGGAQNLSAGSAHAEGASPPRHFIPLSRRRELRRSWRRSEFKGIEGRSVLPLRAAQKAIRGPTTPDYHDSCDSENDGVRHRKRVWRRIGVRQNADDYLATREWLADSSRPSELRPRTDLARGYRRTNPGIVAELESRPVQGFSSGRGWDRTSDPSRVKRVLSR